MIEALTGVAIAVLTIVLARIIRGERWMYSIGLLTLPSLYAFFALQAHEPAVGIQEMIYGIPFIIVGMVCICERSSVSNCGRRILDAAWAVRPDA